MPISTQLKHYSSLQLYYEQRVAHQIATHTLRKRCFPTAEHASRAHKIKVAKAEREREREREENVVAEKAAKRANEENFMKEKFGTAPIQSS
ncbi:hypothetical protein DOM22_10990 [Bdellovibrio sp. ZAP7]|nr:hypothetical protein DOM22_10990 [Bdellovibrio sp. ZAP7]